MRAKLNHPSSTQRNVAEKFPVSGMRLEWMDGGSWRLPSGKALAEFALQAGFLAPLLFNSGRFSVGIAAHDAGDETAARSDVKHFQKGSGQ